jgi:hypothetical protein
MWSAIFLLGILLLLVGLFKRKTRWGKGAALIGSVGVFLSLVVGGPELLEAAKDFRQGFQDGLADR